MPLIEDLKTNDQVAVSCPYRRRCSSHDEPSLRLGQVPLFTEKTLNKFGWRRFDRVKFSIKEAIDVEMADLIA